MELVLDAQSELSLPEGGCEVEGLVRRAAGLGVAGLALADRGTLAAAPAFVRAARAAGIEPRVGVRLALRDARGIDLLVFPRHPGALRALERLAAAGTTSASDLAQAGGEEAFVALAVVHPDSRATGADPRPALRALRSVLGARGLALALPDPGASSFASLLVELGRDLVLPCVLAPPVHIVEAEDASLHRLLVLIRGDHEGGGGTPRPGRPAPGGGTLVAAAASPAADGEVTRDFFEQIAPPDAWLEARSHDLVREAESLEELRQRVLTTCAGRREWPVAARLVAELEALARNGALEPALRAGDFLRSLAEHLALGTAPGWAESWVGWALGFTPSAPAAAGSLPVWVEHHVPLPEVELEMGEAGARVALALAELAGAQEPLAVRRLGADEAARWLARARGLDGGAARRLAALAEGRAGSSERLPPGARRLAALAARLAGRVLAVTGDANTRVWAPFPVPGRRLDRLASEAVRAGGLAVRVAESPTLSLLERAGPAGPARSRLAPAGPGGRAVAWRELADLLDGPLAGRGGAAFARVLRERQPAGVHELARALVLVRRPPDAPAPRLPVGGGGAEAPRRPELLFHADVLHGLRARGAGEATARELLACAAEGRGALLAGLRPGLLRDLEAAGEPPELAEAILTALPRLVPHLEQLPPWLARARALAALGDLAGEAPAALVAAMADLLPDRLQAIFAWARARGVAVLRPDVNASAVDSKVVDCGVAGAGHGARGRMLVRLGLVHLPGLDRAAAEVVTRARGDRPFLGRDDLVRRLQARVPAATLRHLIGREAAVAGGGEGDAPLSGDGGAVARRERGPAGGPDVRALPAARGGGRPTPLLLPALDTGRDAMQYDLFASARRSPRIFTAALSRFGILSLERAIRAPEGSRVRTVGVIRGLRGMVASGGRRLAAAWLEDGDGAADLLLLPSLLEASQDLPLGRPVVVDCRVAGRNGRIQLMVETAVPLELLSSVAQPALEIVLPRGFRRVRALKLRLLKSPGRSPLRVRARDAERAPAAAGLSRLAVTPDDALLADVRSLVGEDNVYLVGEVAGRAGAA